MNSHPKLQLTYALAGVTCFRRSFTNPLLWSHYARGHHGFAVGYDSANDLFGGNRGLKERLVHDVRYEDVAPSLETHDIEDLGLAAITTKPACWAYEQEVRIVKMIGNSLFDVPKDAAKDPFFGAAMSEKRIGEIMALVRLAGMDLRFAIMRFVKDGYGVRPEWITA